MENEQDKAPRRWTAKRRAALVVELLRGDTSVQEAARQHGLTMAEIEQWKERFLRKKIYRLMRLKGWMVHQRMVTPRPRVQKLRSQVEASNERWAIDLTHIHRGTDGWGHLAAVIDCHDRGIVGYEFALRGRAKEAEWALEQACLNRFGALRPVAQTPVIRSDNGLIFQGRRFREACRFYWLKQEYITPYTPEQNGLIERFFRSLKEECVWQHNFESFSEASEKVGGRVRWYNEERPHQALGYQSPAQYRNRKLAAAWF
jgi:putative transposase